jgi:hypothetical protein
MMLGVLVPVWRPGVIARCQRLSFATTSRDAGDRQGGNLLMNNLPEIDVHAIADKAGDLSHKAAAAVSDKAGDLSQKVGDVASGVQQSAGDLATGVERSAQRVLDPKSPASRAVREHSSTSTLILAALIACVLILVGRRMYR